MSTIIHKRLDHVDEEASGSCFVSEGSFYEQRVDITKLEDDEFEAFWDDLAKKNDPDFTASDTIAKRLSETGSTEDDETEELYFGEARQRLLEKLKCRPLRKEILRRTLVLCQTQRDFTEAEEQIQAFPEFPYCNQSPYRFIKILEDGGGLVRLNLDAEGEFITKERVEGLTEDEIDDLIESYALETTDVGKSVADELAPQRRLKKSFAMFPDRSEIYKELLSFTKIKPRSYTDIEALFKGRNFSSFRTIGAEKHVAIKPSVFVDNMEKAGGIVWNKDGWTITREGEEFLKNCLSKCT